MTPLVPTSFSTFCDAERTDFRVILGREGLGVSGKVCKCACTTPVHVGMLLKVCVLGCTVWECLPISTAACLLQLHMYWLALRPFYPDFLKVESFSQQLFFPGFIRAENGLFPVYLGGILTHVYTGAQIHTHVYRHTLQ